MEEPIFEHLSDREILIMTCRETFGNSKRLDSHAKKIHALELWKNWLAGAFAALLAGMGLGGMSGHG